MKQQYLEELRILLNDFDITEDELNDILNDYQQMYEDGERKGLSDEEIYVLLGTPEKVKNELNDSFSPKMTCPRQENHKIVAIMPFLSVILYFVMGSAFHLWHPGWLIFLLIPITAIISNQSHSVIQSLTALSPFIATITFFLVGYYTGVYHPTWLVFLLIPFLGAFNDKKSIRSYGFAIILLISVGLYLFINYYYQEPKLGLLVFLLPIIYGIFTGDFIIQFRFDNQHIAVPLTFFLSMIIYFTFGVLFHSWTYLWMIFLLIPMVAILSAKKGKNTIVALMPFISVILFFSLGFFFGLWAYSWIAFLLIPMVAILVNA